MKKQDDERVTAGSVFPVVLVISVNFFLFFGWLTGSKLLPWW